jgi:hypothetical protein
MSSPIAEQRRRLRNAGFSPLPVEGKRPPMLAWEQELETNDDEIRLWDKLYPYAHSTGILCKYTPTLDIDILNPEAAEAVEALVRERFEEHGCVLVRIGQAPKRAILFRTDAPFKKLSVNLIAPDGSEGQKLELLADGQQVVAFGIHEDTGKPYAWHGGEPGDIARDDLPYVHAEQARALVDDAAALLCREHGYHRAAERPKKARERHGNGHDVAGAADWGFLVESIHAGRELHDSLRDLGGKLITAGMGDGAAVNLLRGLMQQSSAPHDDRWRARFDDIPRLICSAKAPVRPDAAPPPPLPSST